MIKIKASEIKSETIPNVIDEIGNNPVFDNKIRIVANKNNWTQGDTIEAIAQHVVIYDEDYEG